jgi:hypothetical protein
MIHLIYIYLIINSFFVGRYIGAWYKYDNKFEALGYCLCLSLFGAILSCIKLVIDIIKYIYNEFTY